MPVYLLGSALVFPRPEEAEPGGLLAVGGDLSADRLRLAYRLGIFPWFSEREPIAWYSPDPRMVLRPRDVRVNKSLRRSLRTSGYRLTFDTAFPVVIEQCAKVQRAHEEGTWITQEMKRAYIDLHRQGDAHSVEVWDGRELVGGLYGIAAGGCFCGESMFALRADASKVAFVGLARRLEAWGYVLIDCQLPTPHLESLGGTAWPRDHFLRELSSAVSSTGHADEWKNVGAVVAADLVDRPPGS